MQPKNVELVINDLVKVMTDSIANGERIEIRGFGGFSIVLRKARMARNPKTGNKSACLNILSFALHQAKKCETV